MVLLSLVTLVIITNPPPGNHAFIGEKNIKMINKKLKFKYKNKTKLTFKDK